MSDSGFEVKSSEALEPQREILLPFRSERYEYYKSRRNGMLQFVKKAAPEYACDMLTIEALRKEFLLCYPLSHPSIVRYTNYEDNTLYEEFIDGLTLKEMLESDDIRLVDPQFVASLIRQLYSALEYIHSQGILHLDIKPENLMVTRIGNNLKLIDFSCAESATHDNTAGYTPEYKAPEQGNGKTDATTDLYLAGKVAETLAERGGLTRKWQKFLERAAAKSSELRFQSASEALEELPGQEGRGIRPLTGVLILLGVIIAGAIAVWTFWPTYTAEEGVKAEKIPAIDSATSNQHQITSANPQGEEEGKASEIIVDIKPGEDNGNKLAGEGSTPEGHSETDLRKKLEKDIDSHIKAYFNQNVFPLFNDTVRFKEGYRSEGFMEAAREMVQKGYDDAESYGENLISQYPEEATFIRSQIFNSFLSQNNIFNQKIGY